MPTDTAIRKILMKKEERSEARLLQEERDTLKHKLEEIAKVEGEPLRVSFDIGGVLSKYPKQFLTLIKALSLSPNIELYALTDMHDHEQSVRFVHDNGFTMIPENRIINGDYTEYGENCKAQRVEELGIDIHIDDFPGYCANTSCINLFVWPNPSLPYYSDEWKTDGSEGNFGRRAKSNWKSSKG